MHDGVVRQTLTDGPSEVLSSGLLVYSRDTVHLACVHSSTLFLYAPVTQKFQQPYPPREDPSGMTSVSAWSTINQKQCTENGWPYGPHEFATDIPSPIEVNNETKSFAFEAKSSPERFLLR